MKQTFFSTHRARLLFLFLASLPAVLKAQITFQKEYHQPTIITGSIDYSFSDERILSVAQHKGGGNEYFFTGSFLETRWNKIANNYTSYRNNNITKLNKKGQIIWSRRLFTNNNVDEGALVDIKCTYAQNGYITGLVAGGSFRDGVTPAYNGFRLITIDSAGALLNKATYNLSGTTTTCYKVQQTFNTTGAPDGFIAIGFSGGSNDKVIVVKTDANLSKSWSESYNIPVANSRGYSIKQKANRSGYILTGSTGNDLFAMEINASGTIIWQKKCTVSPGFTGKDIVEVPGTIPKYYVLGHDNNDLIVMELDSPGNITAKTRLSIAASKEEATGIEYHSATGYLVLSGTSDGAPILIKIGTGLTSVAFAKKYTNSTFSTPVITTDDGGHVTAGYSKIPHRYYLVKTDGNAVSDCNEDPLTVWLQPLSITAVTSTFSHAAGPNQTAFNPNPTAIQLDENIVCRDLCKNSPAPDIYNADVDACYGKEKELFMPCLSGNIKWFKAPNYTTVLGTGANFMMPGLTSNATYVARCYNDDGCITSERRFNVTLSVAPSAVLDSIFVCNGNYFNLPAPCGLGEDYEWVSPGTTDPYIKDTIYENKEYRVNCKDENGCVVKEHIIRVIPDPGIYAYNPHNVTICQGQSYDLDNVTSGNGICSYTIAAGNIPVSNVVSPVSSTLYYASCRDENGCFSAHSIEVTVIPNTEIVSYHELCIAIDGGEIPFTCSTGYTEMWKHDGVPQATGLVSGPGTYEVTCVRPNGCVARRAIFTVLNELPCDQVIECYSPEQPKTISCPEGTVNSYVTKNGVIYPTVSGTFTPDGPGTYIVICEDVNGIVISKTRYHFHTCDESADKNGGDNTGISTSSGNDAIDVFPNPGNGMLNIRVQTQDANTYSAKVYDMLGREIISKDDMSAKKDGILDLSGYPKGIYHLRLVINGQAYMPKIILQ